MGDSTEMGTFCSTHSLTLLKTLNCITFEDNEKDNKRDFIGKLRRTISLIYFYLKITCCT